MQATLAGYEADIEAELRRRGHFVRETPPGKRSAVRYSAGQAAVELTSTTDGMVEAELTAIFAKPMTSESWWHFQQSAQVEVEQFSRSGILIEAGADGNLRCRLDFRCSPTRLKSRLSHSLRTMRWSVLNMQSALRRAQLSEFVFPSYVDMFWGEAADEAEARLKQTDTSVRNIDIHGIAVHYTEELAGGGHEFGKEAIDFIEQTIGKVGRAFEWCAGPAFLGYSLLSRRLCDSLCVSDINPKAVAMARETAEANHLDGKVSIFLSDCLDQIPEEERWDLVVGNPPWLADGAVLPNWGAPIKYVDLDLRLHRRFFRDVGKHLNPQGRIVLLETYLGTCEADFTQMLHENGLRLERSLPHPRVPVIYIMSIVQAPAGGEAPLGGLSAA